MSQDAVREILSKPVEVIGSGSRSPFRRKVNAFWPAGLALSALLFAAAHHAPSVEAMPTAPVAQAVAVALQEAPAVGPAKVTRGHGHGEHGHADHAPADPVPFPAAPAPAPGGLAVSAVDVSVLPLVAKTDATLAAASDTGRFQLYYQRLGAFVSQPGETQDRFMTRVGSFLAYYTQSTGWEACGLIQEKQDGEGWAVRLITNGSQIGCAQIKFDVPGYVNTDLGIHSHPAKHSVRVSLQDQRLASGPMCGSHRRVFPNAFSERDYHNGAGYLVIPEGFARPARLLFQQGKGTEAVVADLDGPPASPDAVATGVPVEQKNVDYVQLDEVVRKDVAFGARNCKTF